MKHLVTVAFGLLALLMMSTAQAQLFNPSCAVAATPVAFGSYNPSASDNLSSGTVTVTCFVAVNPLGTVNYTIQLGTGGGSFSQRKLAFGGNTLNYNLYTSSARTTVWGDGSGGTQTVSGSVSLTLLLSNVSSNSTVYGRLPTGQYVPAGAYNDTIAVTVTY